eukprot:3136093-Rhodomonas_salina.1
MEMEGVCLSMLHTMSIDRWEQRVPSQLSAGAERIRPQSVEELHTAVRERMEQQTPLCVISKDEELAAYVRSVRAEHPSWKMTCVIAEDEPDEIPTESDEVEWVWRDGAWFVRRLEWVTGDVPTEKEVSSLVKADGVYVISGGLGYIGRL